MDRRYFLGLLPAAPFALQAIAEAEAKLSLPVPVEQLQDVLMYGEYCAVSHELQRTANYDHYQYFTERFVYSLRKVIRKAWDEHYRVFQLDTLNVLERLPDDTASPWSFPTIGWKCYAECTGPRGWSRHVATYKLAPARMKRQMQELHILRLVRERDGQAQGAGLAV